MSSNLPGSQKSAAKEHTSSRKGAKRNLSFVTLLIYNKVMGSS